MPYLVDFKDVSTQGLETSPVSDALAGLRANEARYLKNKFNHDFVVEQAGDATQTIDWVHQILAEERDLHIVSKPLQAAEFEADGSQRAYVFYESGLSINVLYGLEPVPSAPSASSSPMAWKCPRNWRKSSSSPARNPSSPEPSAARSS